MIITLGDARAIDDSITQEDLDAFEVAFRSLTNNSFQNKHIRFKDIEFVGENLIAVKDPIVGIKTGDTIEVNYSHYNDGLFVIEEIAGKQIKVQGTPFFVANTGGSMLTLVQYPADIARGIKKLIAYDKKMASKIGIKSESISRMSTTYYDVNASETVDGYPAALVSFLQKYEKMRW